MPRTAGTCLGIRRPPSIRGGRARRFVLEKATKVVKMSPRYPQESDHGEGFANYAGGSHHLSGAPRFDPHHGGDAACESPRTGPFGEIQWPRRCSHPPPWASPSARDPFLIRLDHALLGTHPTVWLERFSHPVLTEVLTWAYTSYYVLPFLLAVAIYRRGKTEDFDRAVCGLVLCFYISYAVFCLEE